MGERAAATLFVVCVLVLVTSPSLTGTGFQRDAARAATKFERGIGETWDDLKREISKLGAKISEGVSSIT